MPLRLPYKIVPSTIDRAVTTSITGATAAIQPKLTAAYDRATVSNKDCGNDIGRALLNPNLFYP